MKAVIGVVIAVLIFVGLPILSFFALFKQGVAAVDFGMEVLQLAADAFGRLLARAIYGLAFWVLSWGFSGYCAKRFLERWRRRSEPPGSTNTLTD
jgi:hypothetical protein